MYSVEISAQYGQMNRPKETVFVRNVIGMGDEIDGGGFLCPEGDKEIYDQLLDRYLVMRKFKGLVEVATLPGFLFD